MFASKQESILQYLYSIILDLNGRTWLLPIFLPLFTFHYFRFELGAKTINDDLYENLHSTILDLNKDNQNKKVKCSKFTFHYFRFELHPQLYLISQRSNSSFCRSLFFGSVIQ